MRGPARRSKRQKLMVAARMGSVRGMGSAGGEASALHARRGIMSGRITGLLVIGALLLFPAGGLAEDSQPDATITLLGGSVGVGVGVRWGQGVLTYRGAAYPITVEGFLMGEVGVTTGKVEGAVFNLHRIEDFAGTYVSASTGVTVADGGVVTAMWNLQGVRITLTGPTQGLAVQLATEWLRARLTCLDVSGMAPCSRGDLVSGR